MTDRQRAFIAALVYVTHNQYYSGYEDYGVKRLPDGLNMYYFRGVWLRNDLAIDDDKYHKILDYQYFDDPYGVDVTWIGQKRTDTLRIKIPKDNSRFYGYDGDYFQFEGTYYRPDDEVKIRDTSQDRYEYAYQIYR